MNGKGKLIIYGFQAWIATLAVAAVVILGWRGDISGEAIIGVLGAVVGMAGGVTGTVVVTRPHGEPTVSVDATAPPPAA